MTSQEKICEVLKQIKEESEISPDSKRITFKFNNSIVGAGILWHAEEKNILLKLEKEGIIKIHTKTYLSVEVELLEKFEQYYNRHCNSLFLKLKKVNIKASFWRYSNPFYVVWKFFALIWKYKIISSFIVAVVGALAIDYSLALGNVRKIIEFFTSLVT